MCRGPVQEVEHIPAEDAVDTLGRLRETLLQERREIGDAPFLSVAIKIREHVFDTNAASEVLAEERDIGAHDGPQVDEHWAFAGLQGT